MIHSLVSLFVALELGQPIILIAVRIASVLGAGVPKATVNKHGKALFRENEIWFAWQWMVAPPAFDSMRTENQSQPQLGVLVALRPYCCHYFGSFRF